MFHFNIQLIQTVKETYTQCGLQFPLQLLFGVLNLVLPVVVEVDRHSDL